MNMFQIVALIIGLFAVYNITNLIFRFMGVSIQTYGTYILWFMAIIVFFVILPTPKKFFE